MFNRTASTDSFAMCYDETFNSTQFVKYIIGSHTGIYTVTFGAQLTLTDTGFIYNHATDSAGSTGKWYWCAAK